MKEKVEDPGNSNDDFENIFSHVTETCKINERADQRDVENLFKNFLPKTKTEKCFVACWLEHFQVVNRCIYFCFGTIVFFFYCEILFYLTDKKGKISA